MSKWENNIWFYSLKRYSNEEYKQILFNRWKSFLTKYSKTPFDKFKIEFEISELEVRDQRYYDEKSEVCFVCGGYSETDEDIKVFEKEKELYRQLGIVYPDNRNFVNTIITNTETNIVLNMKDFLKEYTFIFNSNQTSTGTKFMLQFFEKDPHCKKILNFLIPFFNLKDEYVIKRVNFSTETVYFNPFVIYLKKFDLYPIMNINKYLYELLFAEGVSVDDMDRLHYVRTD